MKQANFATFTIITFILVLAWMGFTISHIQTTSSINMQQQQDIKPIDGSFDGKIISNITKRITVDPVYTVIQSTPSVSPALSQTTTETGTSSSQTSSALSNTGLPGGTP